MDLDSFLALPRWEILQIIAERPSSPIEISELIGTTISYVSQQLKLLEAKGLIKKRKTGAFEKGKPRNVFSITEEFAHITFLSNNFAKKKKLKLNFKRKAIMRLWFLESERDFKDIETFLSFFGNNLLKNEQVYLDVVKKNLTFSIVSEDLTRKETFDKVIKQLSLNIYSKIFLPGKLEISDSLYLLHGSNEILKKRDESFIGSSLKESINLSKTNYMKGGNS